MIGCFVEMGKSGSALGAQETSLDGDNIFRHIGVRIALRIVSVKLLLEFDKVNVAVRNISSNRSRFPQSLE